MPTDHADQPATHRTLVEGSDQLVILASWNTTSDPYMVRPAVTAIEDATIEDATETVRFA